MADSINCPYCRCKSAYSEFGNRHGVGDQPGISGANYWLVICNNCSHGLVQRYDYKSQETTYFPTVLPSPTSEHIPELIRIDLDEAKTCFSVSAWRATAMMARRSLETACLDKGALGTGLNQKIAELLANGTITKDIKDWADAIRFVGNDAAHPERDSKVNREEAEDILHLAEQFLHILYVAPAMAKQYSQRRNGAPHQS